MKSTRRNFEVGDDQGRVVERRDAPTGSCQAEAAGFRRETLDALRAADDMRPGFPSPGAGQEVPCGLGACPQQE